MGTSQGDEAVPRHGFEEPLGRHYFTQMLYAVGYLHGLMIVHRDLKTENFLLLGRKGAEHENVLKLCDFGTAQKLTPEMPRTKGRVGTLSYMPPEVHAGRGATMSADTWSLGVVLYFILVGANPFRNMETKTKDSTINKISKGDFDQDRYSWLYLSAAAKDLVCQQIVVKEEHRPTCAKSLGHAWLDMDNETNNMQVAVP